MSAMNPMSSVDTTQIEAAMAMATLDTLKGYKQNHYPVVKQPRQKTVHLWQGNLTGAALLREPALNQGTHHNFRSLKILCS